MEHSSISKGDTLEVTLFGKFTFNDNKAFNGMLEAISKKVYKKVVINLNDVDFIDSAALGILLLTRDKCKRTETTLLIQNPKGQVKRMFDISRFADLFHIENPAN